MISALVYFVCKLIYRLARILANILCANYYVLGISVSKEASVSGLSGLVFKFCGEL